MDKNKISIAAALMVAMFLGAVEGTVVTTAVPTIVRDLQGFDVISFVFSVYLLTSSISTPICGKLSDLYGRKKILMIGIIIFLIGSVLCGLSQSMYMLIGFRAIQGIGTGAIFTITFTIVGDVFTLEERPKVQGGLSTVWGIASLAGPFLGGTLIDTLSWHWVFFINIPFGIISLILIQKNLKENLEKKKHKIDFAGILTFSAAMMLFLNLFLSADSSARPLLFSGVSIAATGFLLFLFYRIERKAYEPVFPFDIFTKESILVNTICFLISAVMIGFSVYLPIYMQNVLGFNATISGLSMAPMSVAWLIASVILGNRITKSGEKNVTLFSIAILLISTFFMPLLNIHSPLWFVWIFVFIMGIGFGGAFTTLTIMIQESVSYNKRGAAVAANSLVKTLGQTIGVSVFGSVFNLFIVRYFLQQGISGVDPGNLYQPAAGKVLLTGDQIALSLNSSLHILFIIMTGISCLSFIFSIIMPKKAGTTD